MATKGRRLSPAALRAVPWLGLDLAADAATGKVAVTGVDALGPAAAALAGRTPATLAAIDGIALTATDRIEEPDFLATYAEDRALFAAQSKAVAALRDAPVRLTFTGADGPRALYVRFRDVAGNVSAIANDEGLLSDPTGERRWLPLAIGRAEIVASVASVSAGPGSMAIKPVCGSPTR